MPRGTKKLLIDLYNIQTHKYEKENASTKEIAAHIGIKIGTLYLHIRSGVIIQRKYRLDIKGYESALQQQMYPKTPDYKYTHDTKPINMRSTFGAEWDEICRNYKLLKAGKATIKPVYVKGKRKYHTVILEEGAAV